MSSDPVESARSTPDGNQMAGASPSPPTTLSRNKHTIIRRNAHRVCRLTDAETAKSSYERVVILTPKPEPGLTRLEWEICVWGDGDPTTLRVMLVPDSVADTGEMTTEDVLALGARELTQEVRMDAPRRSPISDLQKRPQEVVRGHRADVWVAALNSRDERFCFVRWAEPEGDRFRVYTLTSPPGTCDDGRALKWANESVEHRPA